MENDVIELDHWVVEEFGIPDFEGSLHRFEAVHSTGWQAFVLVRTLSAYAEIVGLELLPTGTDAPWWTELDLRLGGPGGDLSPRVERYPQGIAPTPDSGEITVSALRTLELGGLFKHCKQVAAVFSGAPDSPIVAKPDRPRGSVRLSDRDLAERAAIYVSLVERGTPSPNAALAKHFGYDKRTAEGWVSAARKRELLTQTEPRKRGGSLTDKAKQLLAEGEKE